MSRAQRPGLAGLSGFIGKPRGSAQFALGKVVFWKQRSQGSLRPRIGRGTNGLPNYRFLTKGGGFVCLGEASNEQAVEPNDWEGQELTLIIQEASGKTIDFAVVVDFVERTYKLEEGEHDLVTITGRIIGTGNYTGFTQSTASEPTRNDIVLYQGSVKVLDVDGLEDRDTIVIDWWDADVDDDDGGEQDKLLEVMAAYLAAEPTDNAKLNIGTIARDALDGGTIRLEYRLTTSAERANNAVSGRMVDPDSKDDHQTTAAFNTTPPASTDTTLFAGPVTYREFNDQMTQQVKAWTRIKSVHALTHAGTYLIDDPDDFGISAAVRLYESNATYSPPAAPHGLLIKWRIQQDRESNGAYTGRWIKDYFFGTSTAKQRIEQAGTFSDDVSNISDRDIQYKTATSATAPGAPTTRISGLVLTTTVGEKIQDTPAKWRFAYVFERLTPEQRIEHSGTTSGGSIITPSLSAVLTRETLVDTCLSTDDAAEIATSLYGASYNDPYFESVSVRKINQLLYAATWQRVNDHLAIHFGMPRIRRERSPVNSTGSYVKIAQAREAGGGMWYGVLGGYNLFIIEQDITVRRRTASISDTALAMMISLWGYTNSAVFKLASGSSTMFAIGTVKVGGGSIRDNVALEGINHRRVTDFGLTFRNIGWWAPNTPTIGYRDIFDVDLSASVGASDHAYAVGAFGWPTDFEPQTSIAAITA